jgi:hypothetical protein
VGGFCCALARGIYEAETSAGSLCWAKKSSIKVRASQFGSIGQIDGKLADELLGLVEAQALAEFVTEHFDVAHQKVAFVAGLGHKHRLTAAQLGDLHEYPGVLHGATANHNPTGVVDLEAPQCLSGVFDIARPDDGDRYDLAHLADA